MPKQSDNKNCILYSNISPMNREPLLEIVRQHKLSIVEIIEEDPIKYKRANKQPELTKVFGMLEMGKIKFLLTESLNHLFTVNPLEVIRYLKVLADLKVMILTPDGSVDYYNPQCTDRLLEYADHRVEFLRTLAARAGKARGSALGRTKVPVNVELLASRVMHYGNVSQAAKELNLCNVTAWRRLLEARYDLDRLRAGEVAILSPADLAEKLSLAKAAREVARVAREAKKIAKLQKTLEI